MPNFYLANLEGHNFFSILTSRRINLSHLFQRDYNFSHRIDKFSFGNPHGGIVQPLEGDEKIAEKSKYFFFNQPIIFLPLFLL